jgi:hypothetical protein
MVIATVMVTPTIWRKDLVLLESISCVVAPLSLLQPLKHDIGGMSLIFAVGLKSGQAACDITSGQGHGVKTRRDMCDH